MVICPCVCSIMQIVGLKSGLMPSERNQRHKVSISIIWSWHISGCTFLYIAQLWHHRFPSSFLSPPSLSLSLSPNLFLKSERYLTCCLVLELWPPQKRSSLCSMRAVLNLRYLQMQSLPWKDIIMWTNIKKHGASHEALSLCESGSPLSPRHAHFSR